MTKRPHAKPRNRNRLSFRPWSGLRTAALLVVWLLVAVTGAHGQVVAGYYPEWRTSSYPPSAIPLQHLTHVIHAFAWPNADGTISWPSGFLNPVPDLVQRAHAAGKKVLISLGGAADSDGFAPMTANATARARFISSLTSLCLQNGYDGVDLDWEFPANATDRQNLNLLVKELRTHWSQAAPNLMLTMTVGAGDWSSRYFDLATLSPLLDWIGVMSYCYYGSWSGFSGHNSPLYSNPADPMAAGSLDQTIREYFYGQRGVSYGKMLAGIPFYGLTYTGTTQLYQRASGGTPTFYRNVAALAYATNWDGVSQVPYLTAAVNGGTIVTFDNPGSVRLKAQYAKSLGLAGVMIWELSQDVVAIGNQPLLAAIGAEMMATSAPPPPPEPPPPAVTQDDYATGEIKGAGSVYGSLASLLADDNVYESLKEWLSGGAAKKRYSYLVHTWTINVTGGSAVEFRVQAHQSASSDGDRFVFAYSTDNVNFTTMLTVTKTRDDNSVQTYTLPATLKGKVYIRAVDTNRAAGTTAQDTLYVDQLCIRSTP